LVQAGFEKSRAFPIHHIPIAMEAWMMTRTRLFLMLACLGVAAPALSQPRAAPSAPDFNRPIEAGSWGGVVRSGPGQSSARIVSLREGERVQLLFNTGIMWNDFPWFLIRFREGQLGFMWGGILCSRGAQVAGTYQTCR
jgi:hypothetical protein